MAEIVDIVRPRVGRRCGRNVALLLLLLVAARQRVVSSREYGLLLPLSLSAVCTATAPLLLLRIAWASLLAAAITTAATAAATTHFCVRACVSELVSVLRVRF